CRPSPHSSPTRRSSDLSHSGLPSFSTAYFQDVSAAFPGGAAANQRSAKHKRSQRSVHAQAYLRLALHISRMSAQRSPAAQPLTRSEEHTSELQSRENIV